MAKFRNHWTPDFKPGRGQVIYLMLLLAALVFGTSDPAFAKRNPAASQTYRVDLAPITSEEKMRYGVQILHPYNVPPKVIQNSMNSLAYQTRKLTWSKRKKIFSSALIKHLGAAIQRVFEKADSNSKVIFKLKNREGKTIIEGDTFLTKDGLNWRFTVLAGLARKVDDFNFLGGSWRLSPLLNQIYKSKEFLWFFDKDLTNWIILAGHKPSSSLELKPVSTQNHAVEAPSSADSNPGIQQRLQFLNDLKNEGLIDEREYKSKKKELMGNL